MKSTAAKDGVIARIHTGVDAAGTGVVDGDGDGMADVGTGMCDNSADVQYQDPRLKALWSQFIDPHTNMLHPSRLIIKVCAQ